MSCQKQASFSLSEPVGETSVVGQPDPVIFKSLRFAAKHPLAIVAISTVLLIPCFWHDHIEAVDLGSHLYNAWLAQLIQRGQAPGLWIAKHGYNVLFDLLLAGLARFFDFATCEKIAVSICVLVFFWGAFAFASSVSRRPAWTVIPILAIASFGWTFHMGFFNYYLSVGLSFWALAIFWHGRWWERLTAVGLAVPVLMAHPVGFCWLAGAIAYVALAQKVPNRSQWLLLAGCGGGLFVIRRYLLSHAATYPAAHSFYFYNGADQLVVFGGRYVLVALALCIFLIAILLFEFYEKRRGSEVLSAGRIPLQLYLIVELAVLLIPDYIHSPVFQAPSAAITARLTLLSAILACCLLGVATPRKWHLIGGLCIAAGFFALIFQDTGTIARMEKRAEQLVQSVPAGSRVVSEGWKLPGGRMLAQHFVDRACVGHCFNYANYEPASGQFRVRARPGNLYVASALHFKSEADLHAGNYEIDAPPLPAYRIYKCPSQADLCLAPFSTQPAATP